MKRSKIHVIGAPELEQETRTICLKKNAKKKIPQIQLKEIIKESLWTPNRIKIKEKNTNAYHNQANQIQGKETILKADRESDIYREWFQ